MKGALKLQTVNKTVKIMSRDDERHSYEKRSLIF